MTSKPVQKKLLPSSLLLSALTLSISLCSTLAHATAYNAIESHPEQSIETNTTPRSETEREHWKANIQWPSKCDDGVERYVERIDDFVGVEVNQWANNQRIISVLCEMGPYNRGEMLFLEHTFDEAADKKQYTPLSFKRFGQIADNPSYTYSKPTQNYQHFQKQTDVLWGNLEVDGKTKTITNRNFYRGTGGCGILTKYTIENGKAVVSELRMKTGCDESTPPPEKWRLYPQSEYAKWPEVTQ